MIGAVLKPFGLDLAIEDVSALFAVGEQRADTSAQHDIHHRYGRSGQNFGKVRVSIVLTASALADHCHSQATRIWDRLFGTCNARIETVEGTKPPVAVAKSEPPATPIGDEAV